MPAEAVAAAKISEFRRQTVIWLSVKAMRQLAKVKLAGSNRGRPRSERREMDRMAPKGRKIISRAKSQVSTVSGTRQARRSTITGCTDLPETVVYCFRASTTSETNRISSAAAIRKTDRPVASAMPPWLRSATVLIRVVTVSRPEVPPAMMEGMP